MSTDQQPTAENIEAPADVTAEPVTETKKRSIRVGIPAIVAGGLVLISVILFFGLQGRSETLTVNFALLDADSTCAGGTGGHNDVGPGMDVVVRNNDSKVIATGALGGGEDLGGMGCVWTAVLSGVPAGEDYYQVSVGDRGEQVYSADDMDENDWTLDLTLGG